MRATHLSVHSFSFAPLEFGSLKNSENKTFKFTTPRPLIALHKNYKIVVHGNLQTSQYFNKMTRGTKLDAWKYICCKIPVTLLSLCCMPMLIDEGYGDMASF